MIVVDTSVWIDHFRSGDDELVRLLRDGRVLAHPWVIGELALGGLSDAAARLLHGLRSADVVRHHELMRCIQTRGLTNTGIGLVDAQLVASALLAAGGRLWTRERRLAAVATRLGVVYSPRAG